MKYKLTINTPLGIFYRYGGIDETQEKVVEALKMLTNITYVSFDKDEYNNSSLIIYEEAWKNSIVEINQIGE
jgi:hypothetical protein